MLALGQYPAGVLVLLGEQVAVQAAAFVLRPVLACRLQLLRGTRWDEWVAVDLAVRVVQGHPDSLALVLEDEDVIDLFAGAELCSGRPRPRSGSYAMLAHGRERRVVVVRVEDDLADAAPWGRWRQVAAPSSGSEAFGAKEGNLFSKTTMS